MKECPNTGGDTLFASAYEAYDLLSTPMQQMLEGLKATFMPPHHIPEKVAGRLWPASRGAPENVGPELRASHPCVRTNPVTGWKSLYAFGHHLERIEGLGDVENKMMLEFTRRLVTENHQLQARVKWGKDDLVIWDNRAVYHVSFPLISKAYEELFMNLLPLYLVCYIRLRRCRCTSGEPSLRMR